MYATKLLFDKRLKISRFVYGMLAVIGGERWGSVQIFRGGIFGGIYVTKWRIGYIYEYSHQEVVRKSRANITPPCTHTETIHNNEEVQKMQRAGFRLLSVAQGTVLCVDTGPFPGG